MAEIVVIGDDDGVLPDIVGDLVRPPAVYRHRQHHLVALLAGHGSGMFAKEYEAVDPGALAAGVAEFAGAQDALVFGIACVRVHLRREADTEEWPGAGLLLQFSRKALRGPMHGVIVYEVVASHSLETSYAVASEETAWDLAKDLTTDDNVFRQDAFQTHI